MILVVCHARHTNCADVVPVAFLRHDLHKRGLRVLDRQLQLDHGQLN